jgi:iron complex transport system ATP-binding protein
MSKLIELEGIRHTFPGIDWKLEIPELSLLSGEIMGIIGPNGSGKSTLLRIAAGILNPLEGRVRLQDNNLKEMDRKTVARHLGYLPQELASEYDITVGDIVCMGRYAYTKAFGSLNQVDHDAARKSLRLTGMHEHRHRRLSQLSGGERKRAFLASVLAQKPRLLLLDEPTGALDIHHQISFFWLLLNLAKEGMGVVVVTHNINLASLFSDRLLLLDQGKPHALGPPGQVLTHENVHSIYGRDILMETHPESGRPTILPRIPSEKKNEV